MSVSYSYGGYMFGTLSGGVFHVPSPNDNSPNSSGVITENTSTFQVNQPVTDTGGNVIPATYMGYVTVSGTQYMILSDGPVGYLMYQSSTAPSSLNSVLNGTSSPTVTASNNAFCFLAGTRIATSFGSVAVENIKIGDYVLGQDGIQQKVYWIGTKTMTSFFTPKEQLPIEIAANALAKGLPQRNCRVMPSHAILIEDVLVVAGKLVNGTTIRQLTPADLGVTYTYYAIETEGHSIIFAEGMPVESKGNIKGDHFAFDNWNEYVALYGENGRNYSALPYRRVRLIDDLPIELSDMLPSIDNMHKVA